MNRTLVPPHVAEKIEPGAILYSSWGYDQTNIDFYYVVRTTEKSCWLVPMANVHHDNHIRSDSDDVTAGEPQWEERWCLCRHDKYAHGDWGCRGAYGDGCDCKRFDPKPIVPALHRIRRWDYYGKIIETVHLTSYSSASLWEGRKLYASYYA